MTRSAPKHQMKPMARVHVPPPTAAPIEGRSWRTDKRKTAERGYGWKWQQARKTFLSRPENVLCRMCQAEGRVEVATVVDHVIPHRGDQTLFWDSSNWQPLCKMHHDGAKQSQDKGGQGHRRVGLDGLPVL